MPFADLVPSGDPDVGVFIAIMGLGFMVGVAGHVTRIPALVVIGIVLVFLGTVLLPLLLVGGSP